MTGIPDDKNNADVDQIPTGIELLVCRDIAVRQKVGIQKYNTTVADNPLNEVQWLQHAYEEALDLAVYLKRLIEMKTQNESSKDEADRRLFPIATETAKRLDNLYSKLKTNEPSTKQSDGVDTQDFWTPRAINDALVLLWAGDPTICRVVAITEDGRCITDIGVNRSEILRLEPEPGYWAKVGYFIQESGGIFQSLFGTPDWEFVPDN